MKKILKAILKALNLPKILPLSSILWCTAFYQKQHKKQNLQLFKSEKHIMNLTSEFLIMASHQSMTSQESPLTR